MTCLILEPPWGNLPPDFSLSSVLFCVISQNQTKPTLDPSTVCLLGMLYAFPLYMDSLSCMKQTFLPSE